VVKEGEVVEEHLEKERGAKSMNITVGSLLLSVFCAYVGIK
jgi:hypothetical protein